MRKLEAGQQGAGPQQCLWGSCRPREPAVKGRECLSVVCAGLLSPSHVMGGILPFLLRKRFADILCCPQFGRLHRAGVGGDSVRKGVRQIASELAQHPQRACVGAQS